MGNYYQPEIETMPVEKLQALQSERLVKQVKYVYDHVEFYRNKMKEAGVEPEDIKGIEDLHKLPFVTKDDLRDQYPYGFLGVPLSECVRMQSTSGTTGRRVVAFYTQEDIDVWEDCCARAIMAAGGTKDDVCHVAYGYGLFTGGAGLHGGSHRVGCMTLPMSSGNTERQIQFMEDLGSTILCCTPSYAASLDFSIDCIRLLYDFSPNPSIAMICSLYCSKLYKSFNSDKNPCSIIFINVASDKPSIFIASRLT